MCHVFHMSSCLLPFLLQSPVHLRVAEHSQLKGTIVVSLHHSTSCSLDNVTRLCRWPSTAFLRRVASAKLNFNLWALLRLQSWAAYSCERQSNRRYITLALFLLRSLTQLRFLVLLLSSPSFPCSTVILIHRQQNERTMKKMLFSALRRSTLREHCRKSSVS